MNTDIGFFVIKPDQITTLNSVLVMVFIPLFNVIVYPLLLKIGIRSSLQKMATGGILIVIAFLLSAWVEHKIDSSEEKSVIILWLVPQLITLSIAEVMFCIPGYEFAYDQAPASMKSIVQALWISTISIGNLFLLIIVKLSLFNSQVNEFLFFAGIMLMSMLVFIYLSQKFKLTKRNLVSK